MLVHLKAQNLGLIRLAEIEPGPGLTVITGETGAGKTLLLGALRLLIGESSGVQIVGPHGDAAQADGLFQDDSELGASRIVPREGRSRSYLEGTVVSAQALQERLSERVQIVGQHDQLGLRKPRVLLELLDSNLGDAGSQAHQAYADAWSTLQDVLAERDRLGGTHMEMVRELDLTRYQLDEIEAAGFSPEDEEVLEAQGLRLRNAGEIRDTLGAALVSLESIESDAGEMVSRLRKIRELDPEGARFAEAAEGLAYAARELSRDLEGSAENLADDPEATALIETRLNLLGTLKMKYGRNLAEVLQYGEEARQRADELTRMIERAEVIEAEVAQARDRVAAAGLALTRARSAAARSIEEAARGHLADLALESASIHFDLDPVEPGARGCDRVSLLFSSHEDVQAGDLSRVASGGELSRLVLALGLATGLGTASTLVFDEVDAGVGGATALTMARKLAALARHRQVLCVTHLPQVAAFAGTHYVVTRNGAEATVKRCEGGARLTELSRMIAGLPESERGQQAAAELLELAAD